MRHLTVTKTARVSRLAFSPDGSRLAVASDGASVRVWDMAAGKPARVLKGTLSGEFVAFAGSPDSLVVVGGLHTPAVLWDLRTPATRELAPAVWFPNETAVSPDGTRHVRFEGKVVCRDVADGRVLWEVPWRHGWGPAPRVCFDPAGVRVFVVAPYSTVLDVPTGRELAGFAIPFPARTDLSAAALSPDGRWLAARSTHGTRVVDAATGETAFEEPSAAFGYGQAFTPDGSRLAMTMFAGCPLVHFRAVGTWRRLPSFDPGIGPLEAIAFSPDGSLAAAGSFDGKVAVWDAG